MKFALFCMSAGTAAGVSLAVLALLSMAVSASGPWEQSLLFAASYASGVAVNFALQSGWVFRASDRWAVTLFLRFTALNIAISICAGALASFLVTVCCNSPDIWERAMALCVAALALAPVNFLLSRRIFGAAAIRPKEKVRMDDGLR